jgi:hypothetical protein
MATKPDEIVQGIATFRIYDQHKTDNHLELVGQTDLFCTGYSKAIFVVQGKLSIITRNESFQEKIDLLANFYLKYYSF